MRTFKVLLMVFAVVIAVGGALASKRAVTLYQNTSSGGGTSGCSTSAVTALPNNCSAAGTKQQCNIEGGIGSGPYLFTDANCATAVKRIN